MVFIGSGRPKTFSRCSPDGLKRMQNIFKETQPDETQRPCIKPQKPSRPKILLKINAKMDRRINASLYEIVSKGLMSFLDNPRSARRIDRCIDSLSYEIHVYNVLHMHQRLYLFHPIAGGYLCITDSICPIRAHSFNFANLLLELFCLTARLRAIPMVAHSAARTFIYWFLRLWMFTSTDAASRVCTCSTR